jgi:hypothetical protein
VPETLHWLAPLPPGGPHVPFRLPLTFTQLPLQHPLFWTQRSPCWAQYDVAAQTPPLHRPEQQSVLTAQPFPNVWQPPGLRDAHRAFVQTPLQHWLPVEQLPATGVSGTQALDEHCPFTQKPEQQSPGSPHDAPTALHAPPSDPLQTFGVGMPQTPPFGHVAPPPH